MSRITRRIAGLGAAAGILFGTLPVTALAQSNDIPGTEWIVRLPQIDDELAPPPLNLQGKARIRLVQTIPGKKLDMTANKTVLFNAVSFEKVTSYQTISPDSLTFAITRTGDESPTATRNIRLEPNQSYTAISLLTAEGIPTLRIVPDKRVAPPTKGASVRVINAAAGGGELDVYARGGMSPLFNAVDSGDATRYRPLPAGSSALEVSSSVKPDASRIKLPSFNLESGKVYTLVLAGISGKSSQVVATLVEDPS